MHYSTSPRFLLTASWVLPVASPPIKDGGLLINEGRIEALLSRAEVEALLAASAPPPHETLEGCVLTPGLFNLHTHLDYTNLAHLADFDGPTMFDWLEGLVAESRAAHNNQEALERSALEGAREAALAGTTFVVDSTFSGAAAHGLAEAGLKGLVGLELFGLDGGLADMLFGMWQDRMAKLADTTSGALPEALKSGRIRLTVAPHAPYTCSPPLWQKAKDWAGERNLPLTCHLAESENEYNWIRSADDRLHKYLLKVMPKKPGDEGEKLLDQLLSSLPWRGQGMSPAAHLGKHNLLDEATIAAHCLWLDDADISLLAAKGVKVAICPRSNSILNNGLPRPLDLLESGITCGFGTDSRASSPNLNLLEEVRFINSGLARMYVWGIATGEGGRTSILDGDKVLSMLTMDSARAVGVEHETGSLSPGKWADIAAFALAPGETQLINGKPWPALPEKETEVAQALFQMDFICRALYVNGRAVVREGAIV